MKPKCAEELLEVIKHESWADRRKALDLWTRRWVATAEVAQAGHISEVKKNGQAIYDLNTKAALCMKLAQGFMEDSVQAVHFDVHTELSTRLSHLSVYVLLQEPRLPTQEEEIIT